MGCEQSIQNESMQALEVALGEYLARNPIGHGEHRHEIESASLAFGAVLRHVPNSICASVGAVQALLAFVRMQTHGNGSCQKPGPR
jgi:hypothetical protein